MPEEAHARHAIIGDHGRYIDDYTFTSLSHQRRKFRDQETGSEYTLSKISSVVSCVGPNGKVPALLIRISTWPFPSSIHLLAAARALDASRRSEEIKSALPPDPRISATVLLPCSALRPTTKTWMPSWG